MRQFECNKLPEGFENEWSRRLVKGGDRYMLRNLNDLNEQQIIHSNVDKMTYFSNAYISCMDVRIIQMVRYNAPCSHRNIFTSHALGNFYYSL